LGLSSNSSCTHHTQVRASHLAWLALAGALLGQAAHCDAVITVNDFCANEARRDDACKTVISREQFERLADALQPGMPPALRLKVAEAYARMMKMAAAAEKRGLDKTPAFDEEMRYARLQLLSHDLARTLREEANQVSDADLKSDYEKNRLSYQQATLVRIFIPRAKRNATQAPLDNDAMTTVAGELRVRCVNGEDPDRLQIEAYSAAGIPGAPSTKLQKVRRAMLPPSHEMVMDMRPGEVSEVVPDPGGGRFIYKMIDKTSLTFDAVKSEIHDQIAERRYREVMASFEGGAVFNDAYFASPTTAHPHKKDRRASKQRQCSGDDDADCQQPPTGAPALDVGQPDPKTQ
jgi:hypothetical protein